MVKRGIRITEVESGSIADKIGLATGDEIIAVNGRRVEDELALRFYLAEETVDLIVRRSNGIEQRFRIERDQEALLGIEVEEFRTRTCNNACIFCFVDQLPRDARPTLRVKDDDYRLSFLHGNYITLTNLGNRELERIIELKLSPLYVSVHATDPGLRTFILGRKRADDLLGKIEKLVEGGIVLHAQVVLMPGINDGKHLEKTIFDLFGFYPGIRSVAIVPLGLSDHGKAKATLKQVTSSFSRTLIRRVSAWQDRFRTQIHGAFVYLADEFYILGGVELPEKKHYDEFAQIEDGVGMVRTFLDDFEAELGLCRKKRPSIEATLVTGKLFFPILRRCVDRLNRCLESRIRVCAAENHYLGKNITVAGLLGGRDILTELDGRSVGDFIVIPHEAISRTEGVLIDNLSLAELTEQIGKPVYSSGRTMRDFFRLMTARRT